MNTSDGSQGANIERLAREAGFVLDPLQDGTGPITRGNYAPTSALTKFYTLVRNEALEEAAKACDNRAAYYRADDDGPNGRDTAEYSAEERATIKSRRTIACEACSAVVRHMKKEAP
jgi:hypothetical protein